MTKATVSTAALATLTTGTVMVKGMAGVYEAAETIVGHPVWTHELGIAMDRARAVIPTQLPGFPVEATVENYQQVLAETIARFGETVEIERGTAVRTAGPVATLHTAVAEAKRRS
jgi:hypothetical protein